MRWALAIFALLLAVVALGFGSAYYVSQPVAYRVVVPASDSHSRQLLEAASDLLATTKAQVRLKVIVNPAGGLPALEKREAEFAVARSVDIMKATAQTVMVLREDAAVILVPKASKIQTLPDLVKAEIGVVRESYMDGVGLAAVMNYYGIAPTKLKLTPLAAVDIGVAIRDKKINALVVAGNLRSKALADITAEAAKGFKGGVRVMAIEAAEAIAKRLPEVEAIEIDKGLFSGYPALPDDDVNTVGLSVRLVADPRLSNDKVSDFLHAFSRVKQQLIARVSGSGGLTVPDPDEDSAFVLHQGVRVFNKGEVVSVLDKYSDQIYIGGLLASAIGSAFAGAFGLVESRRRKKSIAEVMEIERLLDAVAMAESEADLAAIETRVDAVLRLALRKAMNGEIEAAVVAAFELARNELRGRLAQKRQVLACAGPADMALADLAGADDPPTPRLAAE